MLKIAVPIAAREEGTTGEYVADAFKALGHQVEILSQPEFYTAHEAGNFDWYFIVDSGGAFDLCKSEHKLRNYRNIAFWMIDYRTNKFKGKNPTDFATCKELDSRGGWIFQSQFEDMKDCISRGMLRVSWLPLAADVDVWRPYSASQNKIYTLGFVGNVWDATRDRVIKELQAHYGLFWAGAGVVRKQAASAALSNCQFGFNISSFYGTEFAYDVNMRVFETLACGLPLITNWVPSLNQLGLFNVPFVRTYKAEGEIANTVRNALSDPVFCASGNLARQYAEENDYRSRMVWALEILERQRKAPMLSRDI